jgi:hypothetical protein
MVTANIAAEPTPAFWSLERFSIYADPALLSLVAIKGELQDSFAILQQIRNF